MTINHISSKNAFRKLLTASRPVYIKQDKVTVLLEKTDKKYFVQPEIGNEVIITYKTENTKTDQKQSVFLKNFTRQKKTRHCPEILIGRSCRQC